MKAYTLKTDGTKTEVKPMNGKNFRLDEMYRLIGCTCIDIQELANGQLMVLDDEGKMAGKEPNLEASKLFMEGRPSYSQMLESLKAKEAQGYFVINTVQNEADYCTVVGDVLVCDSNMVR